MSSTGHKYVYESGLPYGKPYVVVIKIRGRTYNVGYFATVAEGAAAAKGFNKALKLFWPRMATRKEKGNESKADGNSRSKS